MNDHSTNPTSHPADGLATMPSKAPEALTEALADSPLSVLLDTTGHSRNCVARIRSGRGLGCSCKLPAAPLDDAATVIGLAIRYAGIGASRCVPMPQGIITALTRQVDAGNAAAILVWKWLASRGQIPAASTMRPALRIVRERAE